MDLIILRLTCFFHFEKESIVCIHFNRKAIDMILSTKVCINFHTQLFNTVLFNKCSRLSLATIIKSSNTEVL